MAIPSRRNAGSLVSDIGAVSPPWPAADVAVDDIGLLVVQSANQVISLSDPQGFTELFQLGTGDAGVAGSVRLGVFWARATSTTPPTPTVADSGDHTLARIGVFRSVRRGDRPIEVLSSGVLAAADTAFSIPAGIQVVPDCRFVMLVGNAIDSAASQTSGWANADLGAPSEWFDVNTSSGVGGGYGFADVGRAAAGAFGVTTGTLAASSKQVLIALALLPTIYPRQIAAAA